MTPTEALALTRAAALPRCRLIDDPEFSPCALHAGHGGGCDPHAGPVDWRAVAEVLAAEVTGYQENLLAGAQALKAGRQERVALAAAAIDAERAFEAMRAERDELLGKRVSRVVYDSVCAERDALRATLDATIADLDGLKRRLDDGRSALSASHERMRRIVLAFVDTLGVRYDSLPADPDAAAEVAAVMVRDAVGRAR